MTAPAWRAPTRLIRRGVPTTRYARDELTRVALTDLEKVGPKGYIHGWIKVGPGHVGERVHHPEHGHGTVGRVGTRTSGVHFDSGHYAAFEHGPKGDGGSGKHFAERASVRKPRALGPTEPAPKPEKPARKPRKPVAKKPVASPQAPMRPATAVDGYVKGSDRSKGLDYASAMDGYYNPTGAGTEAAGDTALAHIAHEQGFDGKPSVVSKDEFDQAVKRGEVTELWRGISGANAADYADQYRTGKLHPGLGVNGNGTYASAKKDVADYYGAGYGTSSHGATLRIGLHKDAKVINIQDLDKEMDAWRAARPKARSGDLRDVQNEYAAALAKAKTPRVIANVRRKYRGQLAFYDKDPEGSAMADPGRFAAARGYDAIVIPQAYSPDKTPETIILNRTATIVQDGGQ